MIDKLNLVLCLAGKGQRFIDYGISEPKYLLQNNQGESILSLIIKNLINSGITKFFLFVNKEHLGYKEILTNIVESFKDIYIEVRFVASTSGQAETAKVACEYIKKKFPKEIDEPIGFHNGDTVLMNRGLANYFSYENFVWDGLIDTFESNDPAFSFVKLNGNKVIAIKEKKVISSNATSGLYIFKNLSIYEKFYNSCDFNSKEKYISDVYEHMLYLGNLIINNHSKRSSDTLVLGTPELYKNWKHEHIIRT